MGGWVWGGQGNRGSGSSKSHSESSGVLDAELDPFVQNIFVLRHGEALTGNDSGARPWDPPLSDRGKLQAWRVGRNFRMDEWNITRVVISPFLRCVQTAAEVIAGLCLLPSSVEVCDKGRTIAPNPSCCSIKVHSPYSLLSFHSPFCTISFLPSLQLVDNLCVIRSPLYRSFCN